jgi:hypothetical protein
VPEATDAAYGTADTWNEFHIVAKPLSVVTLETQKIWLHGGALHVHTPQAERIEVYTLSGQLFYAARKNAGQAIFNLTTLPRGVLIVRGANGWSEKIINN